MHYYGIKTKVISCTIFHPAWAVISISGVLIQFRITIHWNQKRPKTSPSPLISRLEKWKLARESLASTWGIQLEKQVSCPAFRALSFRHWIFLLLITFWGNKAGESTCDKSLMARRALEVSISESIQILNFVSRKHELKANQMYNNITICINMKQVQWGEKLIPESQTSKQVASGQALQTGWLGSDSWCFIPRAASSKLLHLPMPLFHLHIGHK